MKWLSLAAGVFVVIVAFQNCSKDMGPEQGAAASQGGPAPSPAPGPAPGPMPSPSPGGPTPNTAIADVKSPVGSTACPASDFGIYNMVNTTPSIPISGLICVKPYPVGGTSVISDVQLVTGTACPAGTELAHTVVADGTDFGLPRWNMTHSICIKRASVPVTGSFVTYFYYSAPGGNCRTGDTANGTATFCMTPNTGGVCMGGVSVNFCKSVQQ